MIFDLNTWTPTPSDTARFWAKVDKRGPNDCWHWTAGKTDGVHGYGVFAARANSTAHNLAAHRVSLYLHHGHIPLGPDVDHTCHNADKTCSGGPTCKHRSCVNPRHLRTATRSENLRGGRGHPAATHCPAGHEYTPENTHISKRNQRICRKCRNARSAAAHKITDKAKQEERRRLGLRTFQPRLLTAFGETKSAMEWSRDPRCQTKYAPMLFRIDRYGWDIERAITTPTRKKARNHAGLSPKA